MEDILRERINTFTESIKKSIEERNWYAATALALTMPDICGKLTDPFEGSAKRYAKWFNKYLGDNYYMGMATGNDIYALRCAFLHQGESNIDSQRAKETADNFRLQAPKVDENGSFTGSHKIKINRFLYLRIDIFCLEIVEGIEKWIEENKDDEKVNSRALNITTIDDSDYVSERILIR